MSPSEANTVELDDFGGAIGGAVGGMVKLYQDPHKNETAWQRVTAAIMSGACGSGFGYLCQSVIEWQWPDVPNTVAIGISFVAGLASGVLSQVAVGLVSELAGRLKTRIVDQIAPAKQNGTGQQHPGGTTGGQQPPAG